MHAERVGTRIWQKWLPSGLVALMCDYFADMQIHITLAGYVGMRVLSTIEVFVLVCLVCNLCHYISLALKLCLNLWLLFGGHVTKIP